MAGGVPDVSFSVPYEIAVVRPLRQTTLGERDAALRAAHFNTELIPQEAIYIDLSTDSGVSALSTEQFAALTGAKSLEPGMGLAAEASAAFARLAEQIQACFGFSYFIPTTQGRSDTGSQCAALPSEASGLWVMPSLSSEPGAVGQAARYMA